MTLAESGEPGQDNFYFLTGKVIREWAGLELLLSQWLIDLLDIDALRSRMIWDSYGDFRGKMNLLKTLTRNFADEELWPDAAAIFVNVETIAGKRYILPHAFGKVDETKNVLSFFSEKFDDDFVVDFVEERSVDTRILHNWVMDITICQNRVIEIGRKLHGAIHHDSLMQRRRIGA